MTTVEEFEKNRYLDIKALVPLDLCRVATTYVLMKEQIEFNPETGDDAQVENSHSVYADTLMETLLYYMKPHMERLTGLELAPTYSYYRVYRPGQQLFRHKDRGSCEISTTICLGFKYNGVSPDYNWGMYVDPESINFDIDPSVGFVSNNKPGKIIYQNPGDAIIYRGCELEHWREPFEAQADSYQAQVFLHYIDKKGPHYPENLYDRRPGLGWNEHNRKNS